MAVHDLFKYAVLAQAKRVDIDLTDPLSVPVLIEANGMMHRWHIDHLAALARPHTRGCPAHRVMAAYEQALTGAPLPQYDEIMPCGTLRVRLEKPLP